MSPPSLREIIRRDKEMQLILGSQVVATEEGNEGISCSHVKMNKVEIKVYFLPQIL